MKLHRNHIGAIGALAFSTLIGQTAAHAEDWSAVVEAAKAEGEVIIYTTLPADQIGGLAKDFNELYPEIKVSPVTDSSTAISSRFLTEHEAVGHATADVVHSATFERLNRDNPTWFVDLAANPGILPSLSEFPAGAYAESENPRSVTIAAYPWQLIVNTDMVKDDIESYTSFADPAYKGQVLILDPRAGANVASFYIQLQKALGDDFITALGNNKSQLSPGVPDLSQRVGAGAYPYGLPTNPSGASKIISAGAPVRLIPTKPVVIGGTTMAITPDGPNPNAARVFGEYLLSARGQELQCEITGLGSLNRSAKGACEKTVIPADGVFASFLPPQEEIDKIIQLLGLN